jgi:hypothetical protein
MDAKHYMGFAVFAALVVSGIITLLVYSALRKEAPQKATGTAAIPKQGSQPQNASVAHLYFGDQGNLFLISEERIVRHTEDPTLFRGPRQSVFNL